MSKQLEAAMSEKLELSDLNGSKSLGFDSSTSPIIGEKPTKGTERRSESLFMQLLQISLFVVIVIVVWALFSLPIIFYETEKTDPSPVLSSVGLANENSTDTQTDNGTEPTCSGELYVGTECREHLLNLQRCVPGFENFMNITIAPTIPQASAEEVIERVFAVGIPRVAPSLECQAQIQPFFCLYYFPLCLDGALYSPTQSECFPLRDDVCTVQKWAEANFLITDSTLGLGLPDFFALPACENLENTTAIECEGSGSGSDQLQPMTENRTCPACKDGFFCEGGLCRSECGEFEVSSHGTTVAIDVLAIVVGIFSFFVLITIFIIAIVRWKVMFTFPNILVFYSAATVFILIVVLLVQYTDRNTLMCEHKSLVDTSEDSSSFCQFAGTAFYYITMQLTIWWLFQVVFVFLEVVFPETVKSFRETIWWKIFHIAIFVFGVCAPAISAGGPHISNDGYHITRSPPFFCFAHEVDDSIYYLAVPVIICAWIGVPLLLTTVWVENKWRTCTEQWTLNSTRSKQFIVLFYYIFYIIFLTTAFALDGSHSARYTQAIREYLLCEANPQGPCSRDFEDHSWPAVTAIAYILVGLYPVPLLIFFVKFRAVKRMLCGPRGKSAPPKV